MAHIKRRIIQLPDILGIKKQEFFNRIETAYSGLRGSALDGDVSSEVIVRILAEFPSVNQDWLLHENGEPLLKPGQTDAKKEYPRQPVGDEVGAPQPLFDRVRPVPFLDMGVQAGWPDQDIQRFIDEWGDEGEVRFISTDFRGGSFFVTKVQGDSMDDGTKRAISNGDEVIIQLIDDFKWNGLSIANNLYVIQTRTGVVLKQITEIHLGKFDEEGDELEAGYIICHSFNRDYSDYRIDLEDVRNFYRVRQINRSSIFV